MSLLDLPRSVVGTQSKTIDDIVREFESCVRSIVASRHLRQAVVRTELTCSSVFLIDRERIHVIGDRTNGMPKSVYLFDHPDVELTFNQLLDSGIWDFGFSDPFVISWPKSILSAFSTERAEILAASAAEWVAAEEMRLMRRSQLVRINPLFGPADFVSEPALCFVLMPFTPELDQIYLSVIKPTMETELGMSCRRADEIRSNRAVMHDIWKAICEARLVVADLTGANPNVFYELGVAHTVGKETLLLSQRAEKFPFDLYHIRRIQYDNTAAGGQALARELAETAKSILAAPRLSEPANSP